MDSVSGPLVILAGLCLINTLAALLSLFIKLGWFAQMLLFIPGMVFGWRMWKKRAGLFALKLPKYSWLVGILLVLIFFTVLENSTHSPSNPDTGIYHAQAIRWMETYPAVPGLGNLHSRLAYNTNWLVLNALFSFSFLGLRSFHVLPGAMALAALVYLVQGVQQLLKGSVTFGNIFKMILIPLLFYTVGAQISSPGTDLPADILIWITLAVWLDYIDIPKDKPGAGLGEIFIFIFSIYLVTIKLSSLPVLLLAAFIFFRQLRLGRKIAVRYLVVAIILLAPWWARNLILSGYWVYPVPAIAHFSPNWDWKIPLERVIQEQRSILAWARLPQADAQEVLAMPLKSWLRQWFENQTANRQALVLGGLASPIVFALGAWLSRRKKCLTGPLILAYAASYVRIDLLVVHSTGYALRVWRAGRDGNPCRGCLPVLGSDRVSYAGPGSAAKNINNRAHPAGDSLPGQRVPAFPGCKQPVLPAGTAGRLRRTPDPAMQYSRDEPAVRRILQ